MFLVLILCATHQEEKELVNPFVEKMRSGHVECIGDGLLTNVSSSFPWNNSYAQVRSEVEELDSYVRYQNSLRKPSNDSTTFLLGEPLTCPLPSNTVYDSTNGRYVCKKRSAASTITAIFTGSARFCHPTLDIIDAVMESHREFMHGFEEILLVFALDGFGDISDESKKKHATKYNISIEEPKYLEYKRRLREKYPQAKFLELEKNVGQRAMLVYAISQVTTPIVYVAQDDFGLKAHVDAFAIATSMLNSILGYNNVRYVLLPKFNRTKQNQKRYWNFAHQSNIAPSASAPLTMREEQLIHGNDAPPFFSPSSVCLPSTAVKVGFNSDNNHFALTELYSKYLLPRASKYKFVENVHTELSLLNPRLWGRYYGSHQYAVTPVLEHLDGRDLKWCGIKADTTYE